MISILQEIDGPMVIMGDFHTDRVSEGLAADVHEAFDTLVDSSYRWGSPEWFQLRQAVMGLKGMKGKTTKQQRRWYKFLRTTGFIWYL